jgi:hypothetical protein
MKEETQQSQGNTGNQGGGVFSSWRKWALGAKSGIETALCQKTTETDWKKVLATRCNRKRITKKAHAGRGQETIWEMSVEGGQGGGWLFLDICLRTQPDGATR